MIDPVLLAEAKAHPEKVITVSSRRRLSQCPRQFCYAHSSMRVDATEQSVQLGNKYHTLLEELYRGNEVPKNNDLLRAWVGAWEDLHPVTVERPFLFRWGKYIIGGVIDLVARESKHTNVWAVDHKISTGQFMSNVPEMSIREQLGIYTLALRSTGLSAAGGVLSRIRLIDDPTGEYAYNLAAAEGASNLVGWPVWGYTAKKDGRIVTAVLHENSQTLRLERDYLPFEQTDIEGIADDLVAAWKTLYGQSFRVLGGHCNYCPYAVDCLDNRKANVSAPEIELDRLHPELVKRLHNLSSL